MGVKTPITLKQVQTLFPDFEITTLLPTQNGVMDTTYIAIAITDEYILKRYERELTCKVQEDAKRLQEFHTLGLQVPLLLAQEKGWYLYTKLQGDLPHSINLCHIVSLARFMATLHTHSAKMQGGALFIDNYPIKKILTYTKQHFFAYYKKLQTLQNYTQENDGFIHGDIFKDNCVFDGEKIGVFDFIDGGGGSFAFDCGVALMALSPHTRLQSYTKIFLQVYNQKRTSAKLTCKELENAIEDAKKFYALVRIYHHNGVLGAKTLL